MTPSSRFRTDRGSYFFGQLKPLLTALLQEANSNEFEEADQRAANLHELVEDARSHSEGDDDVLADYFVLDRYISLVVSYCKTWQLILDGSFRASWMSLQDAMDAMRLMKRFSTLDVSYFENQLVELESAYPYKVFMSVGMRLDYSECSICGKDIDSLECPHRRGDLHQGRMVYGIAHKAVELDHVSIVLNPEDKRCVVEYEDDAEQFRLVRYIADLVRSHQLAVSDFGLEWSKRAQPNPDYQILGRNEPCFCGSGKKFKRCCIDKQAIEGDHAQVIAKPMNVGEAVV